MKVGENIYRLTQQQESFGLTVIMMVTFLLNNFYNYHKKIVIIVGRRHQIKIITQNIVKGCPAL